jgi:hypothetical protein
MLQPLEAIAMTNKTKTKTASEQIFDEARTWPGVTIGDVGRRGERPVLLERHELGHLHGDRVLHIAFRKDVWHELYDAGRIDYHPVFPGKVGWASRQIRSDEDIRDVIVLLRLNYDRGVERHGVADQAA